MVRIQSRLGLGISDAGTSDLDDRLALIREEASRTELLVREFEGCTREAQRRRSLEWQIGQAKQQLADQRTRLAHEQSLCALLGGSPPTAWCGGVPAQVFCFDECTLEESAHGLASDFDSFGLMAEMLVKAADLSRAVLADQPGGPFSLLPVLLGDAAQLATGVQGAVPREGVAGRCWRG